MYICIYEYSVVVEGRGCTSSEWALVASNVSWKWLPCFRVQGWGKVDVRLPGKENSNSHGARPVHSNRTSRLSIKNFLSLEGWGFRVEDSAVRGLRVRV